MAIAFVTTAGSTTGGSPASVTLSNVAAGTDPNNILFACLRANIGDNLTGVTWNGSAMTQIYKYTGTIGFGALYIYATLAPSGTHDIVASQNGSSSRLDISAVVYSGAKQSLTIDSETNTEGTAVASLANSTTVVAANCWLVSFFYCGNLITSIAGDATTQRVNNIGGVCNSTDGTTVLYDSNGTVSTGSRSSTLTPCLNTNMGSMLFSFAPAVAEGPANLKSLDTNVKANIKSYNGNLLANIKSINTNP